MKRLLLGTLCLFLLCPAGRAGWLKEVEISHEPEKDGQMDYTVRILPARTHSCDRIVFECVYHQEFPWEDVRGRRYIKIHEPVSFTYRRPSVRLVADLDAYISFKVPISMARLTAAYGAGVFREDSAVTISRIKLSGLAEGQTCWSYDLKSDRTHDLIGEKDGQ